jgi:hypothetical protein
MPERQAVARRQARVREIMHTLPRKLRKPSAPTSKAATVPRSPVSRPCSLNLCTVARSTLVFGRRRTFSWSHLLDSVVSHSLIREGSRSPHGGAETTPDIGYFAWNLANTRGDAPCVGDDQCQLSYREFTERVDAFGAQLTDCGVGAPNTDE